MAFLQKEQPVPQAEIVALALHVDYWNRLGWKDEYSSPLYSQRQEFYASRFKVGSIYTPQMVVDGNWEFTGSDTGKAVNTVAEAAKAKKGSVELARSADKLIIKIDKLPAHEQATLFLAVVEDDLVSNVGAGENRGKKLEHAAVARELRPIAPIEAAAESFAAETGFPVNPSWKKEKTRVVVFVQENASRKIIGVGKLGFD